MKIGIFCTGRCGSTSLYHALSKSIIDKNEYRSYFEPNNNVLRGGEEFKSINFLYPNIIVKDLVNCIPGSTPYQYTLGITNLKEAIIKHYIDYSLNFDQIILLTRKNELHSAQSWVNVKSTQIYHEPWNFNTKDINNIYPSPSELEHVRNSNDILYGIARFLKKPIVYFEDLFTTNSNVAKNFIKKHNLPIENFNLFYSFLNPNSKYNLKKYV